MEVGTRVTDMGQAMLTAFTSAMSRIMGFIPALLGAIIVFTIGWFVGGMLGKLAARLLRSAGFQRLSEHIGLSQFMQKAGVQRMDASAVLGAGLTWIVRLIFLQIAAETLGLRQITTVMNSLIAFIPNIIVAVLILMVAGFFARVLQSVVRGAASSTGSGSANMLSNLAYWGLFAFGIIAALNQLNIAPLVVNTLFIGLVATLVLSLGLAFGLGGRDVAAQMTKEWAQKAQGLSEEARRQMGPSYNDPLTRPHPSEYEDAQLQTAAAPASPQPRA